MTPEEFRDRWRADEDSVKLVKFSSAALAGVNLSDEMKPFLETAGLPESAAPFLDFESPTDGPLPTASQQWQLSEAYDRYRVIGSNDSGDPICIDEAEGGNVVFLNHDDNFRRVFVNSSILQLAESLLAYRQLVNESVAQNGPDAYLDGDIPEALINWLRQELTRIDSAAVANGCHWSDELANLTGMQF